MDITIRIHKRTHCEILTWILFLGPFILAPLTQYLHLPGSIKYLLDVCWCLLLLEICLKGKKVAGKDVKRLFYWCLIFWVFTAVNYLAHFQSIFYYLWGFRNNFRGYVCFFATIFFIKQRDVEKSLENLNTLFYVNAVIMLFQFYFLGYKQDNLGGIFGVGSGCNAYINIFFGIIAVKNFVYYLEKKILLRKVLIDLGLIFLLISLAEIKYFFIEMIIIFISSIILTKFTLKKILLAGVVIIGLIIGYYAIGSVFPNTDLSVDYFYEYASSDAGYTGQNDFNRLSFLLKANNEYLTSTSLRLTGLGLGNCDYATGYNFLTSPFFLKNEASHYYWLSTAFMYLENGLIGLFFFVGFYILISFFAFIRNKNKIGNSIHNSISMLCGIVAILNAFYNISMRIECCYIIYFIMAIPWCRKENSKNRVKEYYAS